MSKMRRIVNLCLVGYLKNNSTKARSPGNTMMKTNFQKGKLEGNSRVSRDFYLSKKNLGYKLKKGNMGLEGRVFFIYNLKHQTVFN